MPLFDGLDLQAESSDKFYFYGDGVLEYSFLLRALMS